MGNSLFSGALKKMQTKLTDVVAYSLLSDTNTLLLNEWIGKEINICFTGDIYCSHCGRKTRKSYGQGFCFPCFQTVPEADLAIMKPELDKAHLGISRDMEWAKTHSLVEHYVYLAVSSAVKVGITRYNQIPTRWIDQGATKAIRIAKVPYRQLSGLIEVSLKKDFADKTNWRKMLTNTIDNVNLLEEREKAIACLPKEFQKYIIDDIITEIKYPVLSYPQKVSSISLDKTNEIKGKLVGIKGQYLIFENNTVLNIRKHTGYFVNIFA